MPIDIKPSALSTVIAIALAIWTTPTPAANAKDIHVDPEWQGSESDGSSARPWRSLSEVFEHETLPPGDTVHLRTGYYGTLKINNRQNKGTVTITAVDGHVPRFAAIYLAASSHWHLRGLSISPSHGDVEIHKSAVTIQSNSQDITLEDATVMSVPDISAWTAADWNQRAINGIAAGGTRIVLRGNRIRNVNHAIIMSGTRSVVENNLIENFSGDGIRGLGDHTAYRGNTIKNCYKVNDNHDDGFQSWSRGPDGKSGGGEVVGVTLSGNQIINYEDPDQPFRCALQGIGLYDGMYVDWVIENNVVVVDHIHGITVMGARNVRVLNNTVIDPNRTKPGPPRITITRHKNGTQPENNFIVNNLAVFNNAKKYDNWSFAISRKGVILRGNMRVIDPKVFFKDFESGDLRPKPGSRLIDAGTSEMAPATDIDGNPRPRGKGVDVGAYEVQ